MNTGQMLSTLFISCDKGLPAMVCETNKRGPRRKFSTERDIFYHLFSLQKNENLLDEAEKTIDKMAPAVSK